MSEFLSRIFDAAENGDIQKIEGLTKGYLTVWFEKSLREQLTESGYFPDLSPMYSEKYDDLDEEETAKLQEEAVKKVQREDFLLLLESCDWKAIKEIAGYEYLSLFEVALLFGYRVANDPISNIYQYIDLFIDASIFGKINPREPSSKIPYRSIQKSSVVIDGEITLAKPFINLSWELTRKEVYDFAISIFYPENLFTDLLNDTEKPNNEDSEPSRPTNEELSSSQESPVSPSKKTKGLFEDGRPDDVINSLLKIVLGMAIDAYKYDPEAKRNSATGYNKGSIAFALENLPGLKTDSDTIRNYLAEAANRNPTARPRKS